jgi:hypothetical protein
MHSECVKKYSINIFPTNWELIPYSFKCLEFRMSNASFIKKFKLAISSQLANCGNFKIFLQNNNDSATDLLNNFV